MLEAAELGAGELEAEERGAGELDAEELETEELDAEELDAEELACAAASGMPVRVTAERPGVAVRGRVRTRPLALPGQHLLG
ncbi:hypothetical protein [Streptomyces albofaciens]|uniref:hypothetical protein n=1 Tax=Streptomyces albofaciens TaxID=66866 RepID=UPI001239569B|nr:hypothetical protein [Streptomyces albofaciens]